MPKTYFYLGVLKKLKEDLRNTLIKKFKNGLQDFKNILNKIKELELLREIKKLLLRNKI